MIDAAVMLADSDTGKGSPIGLFVVLLLVIAVYFLYRSMNRHLRKLPGGFGGGSGGSADSADLPPQAGGASQTDLANRPEPEGRDDSSR